MDIKFWIVTFCVSGMTTVLGFMLKMWFKQILARLDDLVEEMKTIAASNIKHDEQIKFINASQLTLSQRLNDHGQRLRSLELNKPVK